MGRAAAHGKNIPFLPMLKAFRNYYGVTDADPDRLVREKTAGRLLLTDESFRELPASPTLSALRRAWIRKPSSASSSRRC